MVRSFVALEVPAVAGLIPASSPEGSVAHLTLRFLGELDEPTVAAVRRELAAELLGVPRLSFRLDGVGAFPSPDRPRVVFVDLSEGREAVVALAARVEVGVRRAGVAPESRPFVPHVTVLRVRSPSQRERARELLTLPPSGLPREVIADEVLLVGSELTPHGAIHTPLARFPLHPPPSDGG
ncbi:MAG: RNA 2',3'-cyclic phosphodiesterase [Thermoplasmata archaeon]|nr:RNA 2',3'-cyclic phosphodiesterase [Thermoplasmata archaeon]